MSKRPLCLFAVALLSAAAAATDAAAEIAAEDWPPLLAAIAAVQKEMLPRAAEACRALDPGSTMESCEPEEQRALSQSPVPVWVVYPSYLCQMRSSDPSRGAYALRVRLPASLSKRDGAWYSSPIIFPPAGGDAPPEDQFMRGGRFPARTVPPPAPRPPAPPTGSAPPSGVIQPPTVGWPEAFSAVVLCGLIGYLIWRRTTRLRNSPATAEQEARRRSTST